MALTITDVIPEFALIRDPKLRKNAINCWEDTLKQTGYKPADLKKIPFTPLIRNNLISLAQHMSSLAKQCAACADIINKSYHGAFRVNKDYLIAAALLHDVGKLRGIVKRGKKWIEGKKEKLVHHSMSSAAICLAHNMPEEVVHAIAVHSTDGEGKRHTPEAILLHHIDFMNFEPLLRRRT
jgi:putative nucleotidyltransferase with HDIG domain